MTLLDDLNEAVTPPRCPLCVFIETQHGVTREALCDAASGTMGTRKLAQILAKHGTGIGRRTVIRHREENHQP